MASVSSHPVFAHFPYLRKAFIWTPQGPSGVRYRLPTRRWLSSHLLPRPGFGNFHSRCSITDTDVSFSHVVADTEVPREDLCPVDSDPLPPIVHLKSEILESDCLSLLAEATDVDCVLTALPVLSEEEQKAIAATPAHPNGLYALYASCLCANLVEQLWNFAWPSAIAMLHPSLLPVAVIGFFSKVTIIIGGPLVGKIMDSSPRMPAFINLNIVQAAAQLLSALMIIRAHTGSHGPPSSILIRPWFITLVVAGAIERLCGVASGVATERDWVVLLAGINRPIALAKANAVLSRIDLLCEIAGASIFGVLLSRYDPVTCLKFAAGLMILSLPVIIALSLLTNKLSSGVLDHNRFAQPWYKEAGGADTTNPFSLVHRSLETIKLGWKEYVQQPVLPASLAFVLLFFNVVLAPGSLMTAFLTQRGVNPSIVGGFSGLCSLMGVAATFLSAILVRHLGILQAGAAGLILQASLLCGAVVVYLAGSLTQNSSLIFFLGLIVLSRLGNMAYDVIGQQILQTGIPSGKANLIGATEVSVASLAESLMLGIAIFANDVSHFGILAMLSLLSVAGAAWMFCRWLLNPTEEQRRLFSFEPPYSQLSTDCQAHPKGHLF